MTTAGTGPSPSRFSVVESVLSIGPIPFRCHANESTPAHAPSSSGKFASGQVFLELGFSLAYIRNRDAGIPPVDPPRSKGTLVNICTIATQGEWLDIHAARWLRYVRKNVPSAETYLIYAGNDPTGPVVDGFDHIHAFSAAEAVRPWFNRVRMGACDLFGVGEMLYIDADADVLDDLSAIPTLSPRRCLWCESPIVQPDWVNLCQTLELGNAKPQANNGLLYLRGSFAEEYAKAEAEAENQPLNPRMKGMFTFNLMLRRLPFWEEGRLPDEYGVLWTRPKGWATARIVQFCNDNGQAKRVALEEKWRAVQ